MKRNPAHRREAGFTLIEVLAALVLSSLVLVSLNMAMSAVGKGTDHTRRSLGEQSELGAALDIFSRDVGRIAKIRHPAKPGDFAGYVFDGRSDAIVYPLREAEGLTAPAFTWCASAFGKRTGAPPCCVSARRCRRAMTPPSRNGAILWSC
jgi:prepilin-type N-terminal cleavage/methylation domain-containing protein